LEDKIAFVNGLIDAGVRDLELGAFVRPDRVPQMADTEALYSALRKQRIKAERYTRLWSLVPNRKGMERAIVSGATHVAVFTAATESFTQRNIGMSIRESLAEFKEVMALARAHEISVRGYVSTAFGCPFEGKVSAKKPLKVIDALAKLGVDQISVGDTIGVATPNQVDQVIAPALKTHGIEKIAVHFHDTRGTALANALRAYEIGTRIFDASAGGLGGCPFAPGATGNLATEDLVYMLHGMGVKTHIDLKKLSDTSLALARVMKRPLASRYLQAYSKTCATPL
jgi:hydroxymethylglutaryl-CoA lyase